MKIVIRVLLIVALVFIGQFHYLINFQLDYLLEVTSEDSIAELVFLSFHFLGLIIYFFILLFIIFKILKSSESIGIKGILFLISIVPILGPFLVLERVLEN